MLPIFILVIWFNATEFSEFFYILDINQIMV